MAGTDGLFDAALQRVGVYSWSRPYPHPADAVARVEGGLKGREGYQQRTIVALALFSRLLGVHHPHDLEMYAAGTDILADGVLVVTEQHAAHSLSDHGHLTPLGHVELVDETAEIRSVEVDPSKLGGFSL